ncbi:putative glucosylceramidase 3, partial [Oppia nitens]|uniref:putative glucosylceramidase 3 n=1 Tax=Oppia nitens TaxID=1686743 RepID=UPI0023DAFF9A
NNTKTYTIILQPDCPNHHTVVGHDSFACVCTEQQPCAPVESPKRTAAGIVTKWESGRDGARLRKQTLHFDKLDIHELETCAGSDNQLHFRVNRDVRYQEIFGFGGAFTDASGINLEKIGPKLSDQILRDYFSSDGLEYNVGRIPIGGSDFSARGYSLDDTPEDKTLKHFNLTHEDIDYKIPYIQKAKQLATHEIRLFGSPWSAPAWMKTNNNLVNGGSLKGPVGSEYWQIWAKYFIKYLNAYKAHNISHWGITVQNEPYANTRWNSMLWTPESMRDFLIKNLGPELERNGYGPDKLKVMIWDHNFDKVEEWVHTIFADKTASKYAAGTAIHWYSHLPQTMLDKPYVEHPDKFILATEACIDNGIKMGSWNNAEQYAQDILQDLIHHTIGWVDWNLVLDTQGGPNWVQNFVDAPIIVDYGKQPHVYYRQPQYYALAHFSKFLPPGSVRVDTNIVDQRNTSAMVGAFRTPNKSTVVIVVNNDNNDVELTIEDTKTGRLATKVAAKTIQTYVYYD